MLHSLTMIRTIFFVFLVSFLCINCHTVSKPKFIIDNDAGGDDAMAIFLAILYEMHFDGPKLVALTTGNGNTGEDNVYRNNQRILKVANRQDIPIYRGAKQPIVKSDSDSLHYYGKDGLGDSGDIVTGLVPAKEESAVSALIKYSKIYEGELTVLTIGSLTNVAMAILMDPGFLGRLKQLYVGAGHIYNEDYPEPEFNAGVDAEAYRIVAKHATPDKVSVLPFSQARESLNFTKDWRLNVLGGIKTDIMKNQNKFERISLRRDVRWRKLDPAVVTLYLRPDLVEEYKYSKNDIILCGEKRGITTNEFENKNKSNVRMIYSAKTEECKQFMLDVFQHDAKKY